MDLQYGVRIAGKQLLLEGHFFFLPAGGDVESSPSFDACVA